MVFYLSPGRQREVRERVDFYLTNVPLPSSGRLETRPLPLARRLAELTTYFTFFSFQLPIANLAMVASADAALAAGSKDFCLIQNVGHIFYGEAQLSLDLMAAIEDCSFVIAVPDPDSPYFSLDPLCLLINRRAWEKAGRPSFATPAGKTGARADLPVVSWPQAMRRWMHTFDTRGGSVADWIVALEDPMTAPDSGDSRLRAALRFLRNTPERQEGEKKVFVFNTEGDDDIPKLRLRPGIDRAFVLASGFKANRILEKLGFSDATEVITYDYSRPALALRQMMIESWDGRDYDGFFAKARGPLAARFSEPLVFLPEAITADPAALTREFQRETANVFPSEEQWLAHWRRFVRLKHHFVHADIFAEKELDALLSTYARGQTVVWISDIFNSPNAVTKLSWERRQTLFELLKAILARTTSGDLILGGSPAYWLPGH
jgi:hypothetical protein